MKILVIDVAAEYAGALTILNDFIREASCYETLEWTILVSEENLNFNYPNVNIVSFPWVKTSWFHRLYFEIIYLKKVLESDHYSDVVSLQNTFLIGNKSNKVYTSHLLIHHPVQFYRGFLNPLSFEGLKMIVRKYIIGNLIKYSSQRVDKIYVQTNWMKEEVLKWDRKKSFEVFMTTFRFPEKNKLQFSSQEFNSNKVFIYPAAAGYVKNHITVLKALNYLKKKHQLFPNVVFTISRNENNTSKRLYHYAMRKKLNVNFIGRLERKYLLEYYTYCVVLFPSLIETFGLPLYEAISFNCPVVAIDLPYSHEALDEYTNKTFFRNYKDLGDKLKFIIEQDIEVINSDKFNQNKNLSIIERIVQDQK
jgi:glycosyltransferase involved in cell wall biosynthesis